MTAAHHARAEVYYDMEEYEDAAEQIAKVLERDPSHCDPLSVPPHRARENENGMKRCAPTRPW